MVDGDILRLLRVARDLSLETVAKDANLSKSHLARIESGEREVPAATGERILAAILKADDMDEPVDIEDRDPKYILYLGEKLRDAVTETLAMWQDGTITRTEMIEHVTPLLRCSRDLLTALQVAERRRGRAVKH